MQAVSDKRREKVKALLAEGLSAPSIARKLHVDQSTIYNDKRVIEGKPAYGSGGKKPAPKNGVSMPVYTLARKLQSAVRRQIVEHSGEVGDVEMYATLLARELLGE